MQFANNSGMCISDDADSFWKMEELGNTWRDFARHALNGTSRADEPIDRGGFPRTNSPLRISIFVHVSCWFLRRFWSQKRWTQGEIQSEKQQSILPCVISDNAAAFLSVLHFLKPHRVTVERKRQDAHSIYMRPGKETVWLRQSDGRSNRARDDVFSYFWGGLFRDINKITAYLGNSTRQWIFDRRHHWDRQNPNPEERLVQSSNLGKMSQVSVQLPIIGGFKPMLFVHPGRSWNALDLKISSNRVFFKWVAWKTST